MEYMSAEMPYGHQENMYNEYHVQQPVFTQQEMYGFEPAMESIQQNFNMAMPEQQPWKQNYPAVKQQQYAQYQDLDYFPAFADGSTQGGRSEDTDLYYPMEMQTASSCQASPFVAQSMPQATFYAHPSNPISPVTPSSSPIHPGDGSMNPSVVPSAFMVVPTMVEGSNGQGMQYSFSGFQVPMDSMMYGNGNAYMEINASLPSSRTPFQSQHAYLPQEPSPETEPPALDDDDEEDGEEEEGEEEEEEEEEEAEAEAEEIILPNSGNTELRGMGLYDDVLQRSPSLWSSGYQSPPIAGRGLLLESSFGLENEITMKDEKTGKIVKGKLEIEKESDDTCTGVYGGQANGCMQQRNGTYMGQW